MAKFDNVLSLIVKSEATRGQYLDINDETKLDSTIVISQGFALRPGDKIVFDVLSRETGLPQVFGQKIMQNGKETDRVAYRVAVHKNGDDDKNITFINLGDLYRSYYPEAKDGKVQGQLQRSCDAAEKFRRDFTGKSVREIAKILKDTTIKVKDEFKPMFVQVFGTDGEARAASAPVFTWDGE